MGFRREMSTCSFDELTPQCHHPWHCSSNLRSLLPSPESSSATHIECRVCCRLSVWEKWREARFLPPPSLLCTDRMKGRWKVEWLPCPPSSQLHSCAGACTLLLVLHLVPGAASRPLAAVYWALVLISLRWHEGGGSRERGGGGGEHLIIVMVAGGAKTAEATALAEPCSPSSFTSLQCSTFFFLFALAVCSLPLPTLPTSPSSPSSLNQDLWLYVETDTLIWLLLLCTPLVHVPHPPHLLSSFNIQEIHQKVLWTRLLETAVKFVVGVPVCDHAGTGQEEEEWVQCVCKCRDRTLTLSMCGHLGPFLGMDQKSWSVERRRLGHLMTAAPWGTIHATGSAPQPASWSCVAPPHKKK